MRNCIFCKIIEGEIPADIIYKDKKFVAFEDINPKAPFHILVVPKKHIISINHLKKEDRDLIGELILITKKIARKVKINKKGYKLVFNVGKGGGQLINHLHLHVLGRWRSAKERDIPGMP